MHLVRLDSAVLPEAACTLLQNANLSRFGLSARLLPANPLNHTRKSSRREGLFSFSWTLPSGGRSSASRLRSWQVKPGQSSHEVRFCLSHFPHRRTSSKRIGPRVAPRLFCGDVPLVKVIRSSATDAVASKRMMNIWLARGDPADHEAAPLSWLSPVLQILWPLRI